MIIADGTICKELVDYAKSKNVEILLETLNIGFVDIKKGKFRTTIDLYGDIRTAKRKIDLLVKDEQRWGKDEE